MNHIKTKSELAECCNVSRGTIYKWLRRSDFPTPTPKGWDRAKVMRYAVKALSTAAKAQTGANADLKSRKLELQCEILSAQLSKHRNDLQIDSSKSIPRHQLVEELHQMTLAAWAGMNGLVLSIGASQCRGDAKTYGFVCDMGTDFWAAAKKQMRARLEDSPLNFTIDEIENAVEYAGGSILG